MTGKQSLRQYVERNIVCNKRNLWTLCFPLKENMSDEVGNTSGQRVCVCVCVCVAEMYLLLGYFPKINHHVPIHHHVFLNEILHFCNTSYVENSVTEGCLLCHFVTTWFT